MPSIAVSNLDLAREQLQYARAEILTCAQRLTRSPADAPEDYILMRNAIIEYLESDIAFDAEVARLAGINGAPAPTE